ncbi:hypothetical protein [Actinomadura verrucosospora]|uniref:Uncharacterized protein n=1 Tax=Actinomadura verrucosospora TaxID=46165 RepID=A0A7D4A5M8_ACTVE|nr:hypothetical protein [Actinomadura verrucosospora]QKG23225.1 hypothetical protein ACTIVE_4868 [Actinomadura verrucosospora]
MKLTKFKALVSLDEQAIGAELPAEGCPFTLREKNAEHRLNAFHKVVMSTDDGEPLRPGDVNHVVTMTLLAGKAGADELAEGCRFDLWHGDKVGHGLVSRRLVI